MATVRSQIVNNEAHWTVEGRIDELLLAPSLAGERVTINLASVSSISSQGVRALENLFRALAPKKIVLIHISPAIAFQLNLLPTLRVRVKVESARLPFECAACGVAKSHSVPWRPDSHRRYAPTCSCGQPMHLDGLAEHYLPSREDTTGTIRTHGS